jgi:hypothetical protein
LLTIWAERLMSNGPEQLVTASTLRTAIRKKISEGVGKRVISELVCSFVPVSQAVGRDEAGIKRLPVELIPSQRRMEFLGALAPLTAVVESPVVEVQPAQNSRRSVLTGTR